MARSKAPEAPPPPPVQGQSAAQAPKAPKAPADDARVANLEATVASMANVMSQMSSTMEQLGGNLQHVLAAMGATKPAPGAPPPFRSAAPPEPVDDWGEETYYVRIKPHNPALGHVRRRTLVPELGRPINGGTGAVGDIPEWMPLPREKAQSIMRHRQQGPNSPRVFDVVTFEEMEEINRREDQQRMAGLGMAGLPPAEVLRQSDQGKLTAKVRTPRRERPSAVPGSERYAGAVQAGRRSALEGLSRTPPPAPPASAVEAEYEEPETATPVIRHTTNPDVEDLSVDAARAAIDADIARVAALTPEGEVMGRVTAK